jgi:hypothetical protein
VLPDKQEMPMTLLAPAADFSTAFKADLDGTAVPGRLHRRPAGRPKLRPTLATFGWFGVFAILVAIGAARAFDVVPECRTTPARLAFIPVTEVKAITSAGTPCLVPLGLGSARVDKLTITVDPQHGAVAPRGRTGVIYSPQSDFRGEDAFWLSIDGPSNQNPGAAVVRVGITVE